MNEPQLKRLGNANGMGNRGTHPVRLPVTRDCPSVCDGAAASVFGAIGHSFFPLASLVALMGGAPCLAQPVSELLTTALPYPEYRPVREDHYGLKIGSARIRYDLSMSAIYTDNRNYSSDGNERTDFGLRPVLNFGVFYPVNDRQKLQLDVGVGYQWWDNTSSQNRFYISPNTHLDYEFGLGDVEMRVFNNTSSSSEASSRAEFAGERNPLDIAFNRISNATGLTGRWAGSRRLRLSGGYTYSLGRSLTDQFTTLDRDRHEWDGSAMVVVTAPLSVGISGSYAIFSHTERVQNDGTSFSVGPTARWHPMDSLMFSGNVHYAESVYDRTGTIGDTSGFSGLTFGLNATHFMNRWVTHSVGLSRSVDSGYGSNFTDDFTVNYSVTGVLGPRLTANGGFQYRLARISGTDGEDADLYRISVGVGYQVLRRATLGLRYSRSMRVAEEATREYSENRVTLDVSYRF